MKYWGGMGGKEIIIHFASFTSVVSNKSESFWVLVLVAAVVNLSPTQQGAFDASNSGHKTTPARSNINTPARVFFHQVYPLISSM